MRKNKKLTMQRSYFKDIIADAQDLTDDSIIILKRKFALSKLAKAIWNSNAKCFITKSLRAELDPLVHIITDTTTRWSSPIAHLIPRTPDYQVWGDSSLDAAGGYSTDMGFFWHHSWPDSIRTKSVCFFKRKAKFDDEFFSINLLEYMVIIINYAICSFLY